MKMNTFSEKLEYCFFVETTKIENVSFLYKTSMSEENIKAKKMGSKQWTYYKERTFDSNSFIFLKILFQFKDVKS